MKKPIIDLRSLYTDTAKLAELPAYVANALALAGEGNEVVLTGRAPVWFHSKIALASEFRDNKPVEGSQRCPVDRQLQEPMTGGGRGKASGREVNANDRLLTQPVAILLS
jgi:hypothetical protein